MRIDIDAITKDVVMQVTDFADDENETEEVRMMWDQSISDLKRVLGA
jgi:hypothetical protein